MARTAPLFPGMRSGLRALVLLLAFFCVAAAKTAHAAVAIMPQLDDPAPTRSVAFSPDGRLVLSGDYGKFKLWDAETGRLLRLFKGHSSWVNCLAVSKDGSIIISGSLDNTIKVWDAASGRLLHDLRGHTGWVNSISISPDGQRIIWRARTRLRGSGTRQRAPC